MITIFSIVYILVGIVAMILVGLTYNYRHYNGLFVLLFWPIVLGYLIFFKERKMWFGDEN